MKIFATRTWGFDPITHPIIAFARDGDRNKLLKESRVDDCILIVGTLNDPTAEEDRGRLLGIAKFGRVEINALDVLDESVLRSDDFDSAGNYKWPKALGMTEAWRFPSKPLLKDALSEQLPRNATTQAVLLNDADTERVKSLVAEKIIIPESKVIKRLRKREAVITGGKPTQGVIPSSWSSTVTRQLGEASITYALRFGVTDCWKVGHTSNMAQRLADINKHIPFEITKARWSIAYRQGWENETLAYEMEQKLFLELVKFRTEGERIQCSEEVLKSAWLKVII